MTTEVTDDREESQDGKFLTFLIDGESYGLDIRHVTEIIGMHDITRVPDVPAYVRGIINLRGKVIPVMDVRARFGMAGRDYDARTCIVVIHVRDTEIGLVVDTVSEVIDIPETDIEPPPSIGQVCGGFMSGVGKVGDHVKLLLDAHKLLYGTDASAAA
ncbi:MAG: chemotaxis protein CheW [Nannocystaceae bacterium]|nr:chemotaxis protein CheW [Nannocystaceae bacterium]